MQISCSITDLQELKGQQHTWFFIGQNEFSKNKLNHVEIGCFSMCILKGKGTTLAATYIHINLRLFSFKLGTLCFNYLNENNIVLQRERELKAENQV